MAESTGSGRVDLSALKIEDRARSPRGGGNGRIVAVIVVVALALAAAVALALFGRTPEVETAAARPAPGGAVALLNASGYITPRRRATIAAKITARVVDVYVDEGMDVAEGQVLARLDDSDAQRRLLAARAARDATAAAVPSLEVNLANAERELKRQEGLQKDDITSVEALDNARTAAASLRAQIEAAREQVRSADAQVGVARQDVENCTVRAPFDGVAVSKDAQPGEMISPVSAGGGFTRTGIARSSTCRRSRSRST